MRITLAALFVLGCSPASAPLDASPGDTHRAEVCGACFFNCTDGGWGTCYATAPGVDCGGCLPGSFSECSAGGTVGCYR